MVSIVTGFNNNMVRNFQSFGATLVMFQKYEPRFGPGGPRPEGELRRKDLTLEDAAALSARSPRDPRRLSAAVPLGQHRVPRRSTATTSCDLPAVFGVMQDYPRRHEPLRREGRFMTDTDVEHAADVVVIGDEIRERLFPREDPLEQAGAARP